MSWFKKRKELREKAEQERKELEKEREETRQYYKTIRDYILYLRYMFEYTDDNSHEKQMAEEQLRFIFYKFKNQFNEVTENFQFMYDNLNLYLNSTLLLEQLILNLLLYYHLFHHFFHPKNLLQIVL